MHIIPSLVPTVLLVIPYILSAIIGYVLLWKPLLAYLMEREAATAGARAEAAKLQASSSEAGGELEAKLADARKAVGDIHAEARAAAKAEEAEILKAARAAAEAKVEDALKTIHAERDKASATLKGTAESLSSDIVGQILARA